MKKSSIYFIITLCFSVPAIAQQSHMDAGQLQKIIEQVQQQNGGRVKINGAMVMAAIGVQQCLEEKVGSEGMQRLADSGKSLNDRVKPLCASGERDRAFALQKEYALAMMKKPEYVGLRACADVYKDAFSGEEFAEMRGLIDRPDQTTRHICDYQRH